jgi:hypothetical protein
MNKIYTALIVVAFGIGAYIGKVSFSTTKTVEVNHETVRTDVQTVVHEVVRPDGSKEVVTTTVDHTIDRKDEKHTAIVAAPQPQWHVSASASSDFSGPALIYGLQIEKQLIGPFSVGVRADTQKTIGLVIGWSF